MEDCGNTVVEAIKAVLAKPEFKRGGRLAGAVKTAGTRLLDSRNAAKVTKFSKALMEALHSSLSEVGVCRSNAIRRTPVENLSLSVNPLITNYVGSALHRY